MSLTSDENAPIGALDDDSANEETPDAACAAAEALFASGQSAAAWQRCSPLLLGPAPVPRRVYEISAKALIAGVLDGSVAGDDRSPTVLAGLRELILQAADGSPGSVDGNGQDQPPVLAAQLESQRVSGRLDAVQRVGALLSEPLQAVFASEQANKHAAVLLLVTRESQGRWLDEGHARALHLAWFHRFDRVDLGLVYNFLFGAGRQAHLNRDDIRSLAANPADLVAADSNCSLLHLLFVEMLTDVRLFDSADDLADFIVSRRNGWDRSEDSRRAALSLLARYSAADEPARAARLAAVGCGLHLPGAHGDTSGAWRSPTPPVPAGERELLGARWLYDRRWQAAQAAHSVAVAKFPFLALVGRRRLKVAVCVSGQLRGYQQALASWRRVFLPRVDATFFVHSWQSVGRAGANPVRYILPFEGAAFTAKYREVCATLGFDEVCARYPGLFRALAESAQVDVATIAATYGTDHVRLEDEQAPAIAGLGNVQKMHRKIEACHGLAMASGAGFDLVVRIRPDKPVALVGFDWAGLAQACRRRPLLFADHPMGLHYANLAIGDQFAIGLPAPMTIYARTWSLYPALAENQLFQCGPAFAGHTSLAQVCWAYDVAVERVPIRFGDLREAEPMGAADIAHHLRLDAEGRMDAFDRSLIDAAAGDASRARRAA